MSLARVLSPNTDEKLNKNLLARLQKIANEQNITAPAQTVECIRAPELPPEGPLTRSQQWQSIIWSIDSAESHGAASLRGLAMAFGKIIQSHYFETLIMDARRHSEPHSDLSDLLWKEDLPLTGKLETIHDLIREVPGSGPVDLAKSILLSAPWERFRLFRALENLGQHPWQQDSNHQATVWLPWPMIWVTNGYHSTAIGALYGEAVMTDIPCYDSSSLLSAVKPDGTNWLRTHDGSVVESISSLPMAAIFEIGRRLVHIYNQAQPIATRSSV